MKTIAVALATTLALALACPPAALAAPHDPGPLPPTSPAAVQDETRTVVGTVRQQATDPVHPPADGGAAGHSHLVLATATETLMLMGSTARPNTRVRVTGLVSDGTMHAETVTEIGAAPAAVQTHGTTRILLLLAYWTAPDTVTPESAATQLFTDTSNWYRDASYGQLGLTGDVTPWLKITGPADGRCYGDSGSIMEQAKTAALAKGFDPAGYDDVVVYFPINVGQPGSDCDAYAGWAFVGAQGAWLNGYLDRYTTVHELGHNYGLWHSHSYLCTDVLTGSCSFQEYGDSFDTMGNRTSVGHFSAPQKYLLGWLDGRLADLSRGGSATIAPIAFDPVATTGVRIAASPTRTYWLEYRQPIDFDANVPAGGTDGILVHVVDQSIAADGGPNLIDVRPSDGPTALDATLRSGSSWTSPEGVEVTVGAVTTAGAAVTVTLDDATAPTVIARTPAADATGVDRGDSVTATFSKAVTGVGTSTFRLKDAKTGSTVKATVSRDGSTDRWVLDPRDDLSGDTRYTASLTGGAGAIRDSSGRPLASTSWAFLTSAAPTVKSSSPKPGATNVSRSGNISATFSKAVTGVDAATFALATTGTGAPVPATVSRKGGKNQWQLNPRGDLTPDTGYRVLLIGGPNAIRDSAGNPLATTSWTFVTGPAPTVKSSSPRSGAKNVSRSGSVAVTFSEAVTGVDAATFTLRKGSGSPISATIVHNGDGNEWILDPSATLSSSTRYTVRLTGGANAIRDAAGNALSSKSWTFTTKK